MEKLSAIAAGVVDLQGTNDTNFHLSAPWVKGALMAIKHTDQPWRWIKIQIPAETHKDLKARAVDEDTTLQALVLEALQVSLKKKR